jgi:hypothetical protein
MANGITQAEGWNPGQLWSKGDPNSPNWVKRLLGEDCDDTQQDGDGSPDLPYRRTGSGSAASVNSFDPNDMLAPAGYGDAAYVQGDGSLAYTVLFENKADATAPARLVSVTDTLDENPNLDTFELTGINFANQTLPIPAGLSHYATRASRLPP